MCKFLNGMISSWHHGRGGKYTKAGEEKIALYHFRLALINARKAGEQVTVAIETECIARTYFRLGDYTNAKKYAVESVNIYNTLGTGPVISSSVKRVNELLELLNGVENRENIGDGSN